jgi:hypothetical protein
MTTQRSAFSHASNWGLILLLATCGSVGAAEVPPAQPTPTQSLERTASGAPDISGQWNFASDDPVNPTGGSEDLVHGILKLDSEFLAKLGVPVKKQLRWAGSLVKGTSDGEVPYQPWARAKRQERGVKFMNPPSEDFVPPGARCLLYGMPHTMLRGGPHVYQFKDHILMLWEYPQMHRIIWTDGRPPLYAGIRLWQGFSSGHWDGDTLTVTTTNQNGFPWLDQTGDVMGQDTKTIETIRVVGPTRIAYKVVVEDPSIYTQPWWMEWNFTIRKSKALEASKGPVGASGIPKDVTSVMMGSDEILEVACVEGDRQHALDSVQVARPAKSKKNTARPAQSSAH